MIIIGLTGSIGMGKTASAAMFRAEGCPVFDADKAVHDLYAKDGKAVPLIKAVFPDAIKDGAVDRAVLGGHMRADPLNLTVLESFIHPMVSEKRRAFLTDAQQSGADIAVFDVPLLFETGGDKHVDIIVVVTAPPDMQRARVLARPGMMADVFESLLARQTPDAEKRARADFIVYTDKGLEHAREQVQAILRSIRQGEYKTRGLS